MTSRWIPAHAAGALLMLPPLAAFAQDPMAGSHEIIYAGMAGGLLFLVAIFGLGVYGEHRKGRQRADLIAQFLAKGEPIPPQLWGVPAAAAKQELPARHRRQRYIHRGIAALCWGLGLSIGFYFLSGGETRALAWGLVFFFPSAGAFINAWLVDREMRAAAQRAADA